MNKVLETILASKEAVGPNGEIVSIHSHVDEQEGALLQKLTREVDPTVTLEIGLAFGISALFICDALHRRADTRHIAIDPYQHDSKICDWNGIGMLTLQRAGFGDIVHLIEKPSYSALPELFVAGQKIDFAFVDGWHTFDFALVDFFYIDRMLRVGGIVAFDDADWPAIRKLCRFIARNCSYTPAGCSGPMARESWKRRVAGAFLKRTPIGRLASSETVHPNATLGIGGSCVAFRKVSDDRRNWDHFKDF